MIDHCEKETLLVQNLRVKSVKGITDKYNWDYITNEYLEIFKKLIIKRY